jgi:phage portal protein BeeE
LARRCFEPRDAEAALALVTARSAGQGLLEALAAHVLLHGNGYAQIGCDGDGVPVRLFALRPERVSVEARERAAGLGRARFRPASGRGL